MERSRSFLVGLLFWMGCVDDPSLAIPDLAGVDLRDGGDLSSSDRDLLPLGSEDCLNEVDDNGDGLIDCADPLCDEFECAADGGDVPLGVLIDKLSACPDGYNRQQPLRRGVVPTGCTGCSCQVWTDCVYRVQLFGDSSCATTLTPNYYPPTNDYNDLNTNCLFALPPPKNIGSVKVTLDHFLQSRCFGAGTSTLGPLGWNVDLVFCSADRGGGCAGGGRCVRRRNEALCVLRDANDVCPDAYATDLELHYQSVDDQRSCKSCGSACALTVPGTCSTGFIPGDLVANKEELCANDAAAQVGVIYSSTQLGVCQIAPLSGVKSMHFNITEGAFGGACTVSTLADGTATPTEPTRVCCH